MMDCVCHLRLTLQRFLLSMHQEDGGFIMHKDGELDIRLDSRSRVRLDLC